MTVLLGTQSIFSGHELACATEREFCWKVTALASGKVGTIEVRLGTTNGTATSYFLTVRAVEAGKPGKRIAVMKGKESAATKSVWLKAEEIVTEGEVVSGTEYFIGVLAQGGSLRTELEKASGGANYFESKTPTLKEPSDVEVFEEIAGAFGPVDIAVLEATGETKKLAGVAKVKFGQSDQLAAQAALAGPATVKFSQTAKLEREEGETKKLKGALTVKIGAANTLGARASLKAVVYMPITDEAGLVSGVGIRGTMPVKLGAGAGVAPTAGLAGQSQVVLGGSNALGARAVLAAVASVRASLHGAVGANALLRAVAAVRTALAGLLKAGGSEPEDHHATLIVRNNRQATLNVSNGRQATLKLRG
jgi:hypothetical protein